MAFRLKMGEQGDERHLQHADSVQCGAGSHQVCAVTSCAGSRAASEVPTGHPPRGEWGGAQGDEWHLGDYRRIPSQIQGAATAASLVRSRVPHQPPPLVSLHPWGLGARRVVRSGKEASHSREYDPHRPRALGDHPDSGSSTGPSTGTGPRHACMAAPTDTPASTETRVSDS